MKNSEICRAAMPFILTPDFGDGRWFGMCDSIRSGVNAGDPGPILKILFRNEDEFEKATLYYYMNGCEEGYTSYYYMNGCEEGYTSRIIFLELAALMWEDEGN